MAKQASSVSDRCVYAGNAKIRPAMPAEKGVAIQLFQIVQLPSHPGKKH